jgi:D-glycero-alpha-D-manno-heptose-7-phosphate kinase
MIVASSPLRLSFGSADHSPFAERFQGNALNFCVSKRVYIMIRQRNDLEETKYRVSYSRTELCNDIEEIELCVMRQAIKMVGIEEPLEIIYSSDCPHQMGLGTSTAMAAALLKGLYLFKDTGITNELLFDHVYKLERDVCGCTGGYQDGAVIWGGFNYLEGYPYNVKRIPVVLPIQTLDIFKKHLLLIYTGNRGDSSKALEDQLALLKCGDTLNETLLLKKLVQEMYATLLLPNFHPLTLVDTMREAWELKKKLSPTMVNSTIEFIEETVRNTDDNSAIRLVGGGAGRGLVLCLAAPESLARIKEAVAPLKVIDVEFDYEGVKARRIF